jgi:hypothetical protein
VIRMETRVLMNIYESKPECRWNLRRCRLWKLEDAENDSREMKVKRWRQTANDTEECASVVKGVKVLRGS